MTKQMTYQPKGSMCANCKFKHNDCSYLKFKDMPKYEVLETVTVVICKRYKKHA